MKLLSISAINDCRLAPPVRVYAVASAATIAISTALANMLRVMRTNPLFALTPAPRV